MGYFEKNTYPFMTELWNLLLDAEGQDTGIVF
jgi:serine/arginine repetitive matrix protein 1